MAATLPANTNKHRLLPTASLSVWTCARKCSCSVQTWLRSLYTLCMQAFQAGHVPWMKSRRKAHYSDSKYVHCVKCSVQIGMADLDRDGCPEGKCHFQSTPSGGCLQGEGMRASVGLCSEDGGLSPSKGHHSTLHPHPRINLQCIPSPCSSN